MTKSRTNGRAWPAEQRVLHKEVYGKLRQMLLQGDFQAGESLTLDRISEEMGTSHMPVREAIGKLVAEGAIHQNSNRSFTVPTLTSADLRELLELRLFLETYAARNTCVLKDTEAARALMRLNNQMRERLEERDKRGALKSNQAFHFTLYRAGASSALMHIIELLWLRCGPYLSAALFALPDAEGHFSRATELHQDIIQGLLEQNEARVIDALEADLKQTADWYLAHSGEPVPNAALPSPGRSIAFGG